MARLPTEKLARRLRGYPDAQGDRLALLCLSGSLNPIHTQHMRALEAARTTLEGRGWTVVAGFLAPARDEFVMGKLGSNAWPFEERTRLCEIACRDSEWVDVCSWGEFRSYRLCAALREYLEGECAALKGRKLTGVEIMGSDAAIRILDKNIADWDASSPEEQRPWYRGRVVCCLLRAGSDGARDKEHIEKHIARRVVDLGVELVVVDPESIRPPLEAVNSTAIRELLAARDLKRLRATGWLHPLVLDALENNIGGVRAEGLGSTLGRAHGARAQFPHWRSGAPRGVRQCP